MTGPVCAMSLGVLVASQSPAPAAVLRRLQFFSVTLATPLLLLSCNLKELCGPATRRLLGAFAVGAVSTASAALLAALVLRHPLSAALGGWETASKAIAALTSKNIGSGINFVAVAQALQMKPLIIAASLAVDSALGVIYFPVAASLTPKNSESRGRGATLEEQGRGPEHFSLTESLTTFLVALAIAFLAHQFSPAGYACITSSLLAVLLGTFPAAKRWPAGEALGWPLLYLYFAAAGRAWQHLAALLASDRLWDHALCHSPAPDPPPRPPRQAHARGAPGRQQRQHRWPRYGELIGQ
ncbi:Putative membrane protein YjcL [Durusdinium trenchii]|uniref:Membrane protein YjcL n=1 Tax=Durusdinium trenchii TaxID=1381693 RepID=A0ABP0KFG5_9DINO